MPYFTPEIRRQKAHDLGILVDPEDEWLLEEYSWHLANGYAVTSLRTEYGKRNVFLHHCIMGQPIWEGDEIDHINRIRYDDRRGNLRYTTKAQNATNSNRGFGECGVRNVYFCHGGRYQVSVRKAGTLHYLGSFSTLDEAVATRDEWLYNYDKESV
jgi:hypothetical protein